jgi:hypothetical protein
VWLLVPFRHALLPAHIPLATINARFVSNLVQAMCVRTGQLAKMHWKLPINFATSCMTALEPHNTRTLCQCEHYMAQAVIGKISNAVVANAA